jgi:hypothetical protein
MLALLLLMGPAASSAPSAPVSVNSNKPTAAAAKAAAAALPPPAPAVELFAWDSGRGGNPELLEQLPGLTTLGTFGWPPTPEFVQAAHAKRIKVVRATGVNCSLIATAAGRAGIVNELVASMASAGADGLNIDEESYAGPPEHFTALIRELKAALAPTHGSLSLAVPSWPVNPHYAKIHYRTGLNYTAIGAIADYLVIMGYDLPYIEPCSHTGNCSQTPLWPPLANAPLPALQRTVQQYQQLGVAASRLVMALPWYGKDYACQSAAGAADLPDPAGGPGHCTLLTPDTASGTWPCTGCYTHLPTCVPLVNYEVIAATAYANITAHKIDPITQSVYFEYTNATSSPARKAEAEAGAGSHQGCPGYRHQIWYDNATTLAVKSKWAQQAGLRGAGVYAVGMANTSRHRGMWSAITRPWLPVAAASGDGGLGAAGIH